MNEEQNIKIKIEVEKITQWGSEYQVLYVHSQDNGDVRSLIQVFGHRSKTAPFNDHTHFH